jgi:hypothetical protein
MSDYTAFNKCIGNLTKADLEEMSKLKYNEEKFIGFMRYVTMLKDNDPKRVAG